MTKGSAPGWSEDFADVAALYEEALPSTRSGPLFNAFSYPTKISPEAIALFIACHTKPGDVVLDTFAGSGTTGIAARLCDAPTESMRTTATKLGLHPQWGPREAVLYEISIVGSLLARTMSHPPNPAAFSKVAHSLLKAATDDLGWLYAAESDTGEAGQLRHVIWSEVLACPHCDERTTYYSAAVQRDPLELVSAYDCPGCGKPVEVSGAGRATVSSKDAVDGRIIEHRLRVPVRIYGSTGSKKWQRDVSDSDRALIDRIESTDIPGWFPTQKVFWGDLHRAGYHHGIDRYHHFYTRRNLVALASLWRLVEEQPSELHDALRLWILSFNASHSTLMTRVVVKHSQRDFVLTGAQSGVLYVSGLPVEKNVFAGVKRKIRTFTEAFELTHESRSAVTVVNGSSTNLQLADESVHYVFTDPPFGGFIPYAELNQINEAWLGRTTDRTEEAIVSAAQGKGVDDYGSLLERVFSEVARVMRTDALATVVFHSSKADVWNAVIGSFESNGLAVVGTSVLDKTQATFKQVVASSSARGDALILLAPNKQVSLIDEGRDPQDLIKLMIRQAIESVDEAERRPDRIYSRYVGHCLSSGLAVQIGSGAFYRLVQTHQKGILA